MGAERRRRTAQNDHTTDAVTAETVTQEEPLAFEEALGRLDETVAALEGGQLPLDEAIRLYEEGVRLAQRCQRMLDTAELRLERLRLATESDGAPGAFIVEPFQLDDRD